MPPPPNPAAILVVDDDEVVLQVLSRVLSREGHTVLQATGSTQALQLAEQLPPRLALLDLCLTDGDGVDLAQKLHARQAGLPLILMTAYPLRLREYPELKDHFRQVLNKPLDLQQLRQAVNDALGEEPVREFTSPPAPEPEDTKPASHQPPEPAEPAGAGRPRRRPLAWLGSAAFAVFVVSVLVLFVLWVTGMVSLPQRSTYAGEPAKPAPPLLGVELVPGVPHTLAVPEDVRTTLGIRKGNTELIAVATAPTKTRPLVMPGSTALDPTHLYRIRARFAPSPSSAEVVEIAQVHEDPSQSGTPESVFREIRSGDRVTKGDLLAVFNSVDVGNMKNNLIDAIYQLELDREILKKAEASSGAVPEVFMLTYRRNVQGDINLINRTVNTLLTWGIPEDDIQKVRDEAEEVNKRQGEHDKAKDALWARVELRAPDDGVIVERNLALHEIVVDNTTNLFQIAKVDQLSVFANVPEDDLPALEALRPEQRRWTVKTVGSAPIPGRIDDVGYLIDPNQHTAVVKGHIVNPREVLRGGQFISATVELPPPADVVEVPIDAVVDDGQQCVVFLETDPAKHYYTMRRVELTQRFDKTGFVRSKPFAKGQERTPEDEELGLMPKKPLLPGERILRAGVGELKAALLDLEAESNRARRQEAKDK